MAANASSPQPEQDLIASIRQSVVLLVIDTAGVVQEANSLALERLGRSEEEVVGNSLQDLLDGELNDPAAWKELLAGIFQKRIRRRVISLHSTHDHVLTVAASLHLHGAGKSATATLLGTELDPAQLLALQPRQAALEQIQQRLLLIEFDATGSITTVNPQGLSLLGYRLADLQGRTEEVLLSTTVFESEKCQDKWRDLQAGKSVDQFCHFYAQDGGDVFVDAHYQPLRDSKGEVCGALLLGCDVSNSEKRLRKAFAMMEKKSAALNEALQEAREARQMREEMDRTLQAMATPVTPIWDQVLLLPLVGLVDSTRTDDAMKTTLEKISTTGAKMFILDISGVPSVDTAVANQLIKITKATRIMGCETIVSGVSSSIAHTIVELGIDIGDMMTTSSLRDAVSISLDRVNAEEKEKKKTKKISKKAKRER